MIHSIEELFNEITDYFLTPYKLESPIRFRAQRRQKENWFHDQLRDLFISLEAQGQLSPGWDHEVRLNEALSRTEEEKSQEDIDFKMIINQQPMYLEVKTVYLGKQRNSTFTPAFYLNSGTSSQYVGRDVRKLKKLSHIARCFCLVFVYPSPGSPEVKQQKNWKSWEDSMRDLCRDMHAEGVNVTDITPPYHNRG